jgi:apolipoprotein D and lipocalin family protein
MNHARLGLLAMLFLAGCQSTPVNTLPLAQVDLDRFMGDWYVIAATPSFMDRQAHDAVESYRREADGSIATTYSFRDGGFGATPTVYRPRGFVQPGTGNAVWGMQFVWPIRADYRIAWIAPDYSRVVIAREKRDYAWIMARTPRIPEEQLQEHYEFLRANGYDVGKLRRIPHWPPGGAR